MIAPSVSVHSHLTILQETTVDPPRLIDTLGQAFIDAIAIFISVDHVLFAHAHLSIYIIFVFFSNLQTRGSVGPVKQQ